MNNIDNIPFKTFKYGIHIINITDVNTLNGVQQRIFIIPVGIDSARAKHTPVSPDQIYLVTQHQDLSKKIVDEARENVIEVYDYFSFLSHRLIYGVVEFFNLAEIMSLYRYICDNHLDDQIFINVGSGSKLTAMAGFMVSGWYSNVQCYYPKMKVSVVTASHQKVVDNEIERTDLIGSFPVRKIDYNLIPILNFLKNDKRQKKEILNFLQNKGYIDTHFETDDGKKKERSIQSLYNLLKRNYLNPLDEDHLILETETGEIQLTEQGKRMQLIFGKSNFIIETI